MQSHQNTCEAIADDDGVSRVLLASENRTLRADICALLKNGALVKVVAEPNNSGKILEAADSFCPNLVIVCASEDTADQVAMVQMLVERCPNSHILVLGSAVKFDASYLATVLQATVESLRRMVSDTLEPALNVPAVPTDEAAAGKTFSEPIAIQMLTSREQQVLQAVADGMSSKEIADRLTISVRTVESHRNQIMNKLSMRSVAMLTKYAIRQGITTT